jgi:ankyrin repeat protein
MNAVDRELIDAAEESNLSEVERLLSVGANVNATSDTGWMPLHWACLKGHLQVFQALRGHGANIEAKGIQGNIEVTTRFGNTPLHFACHSGHLAVVIELLSPSDIEGATTTSILGKRKKRQGANIEAQDRYGDTPLHDACLRGHMSVVKALVNAGADFLAVNNKGRLPIHRAVHDGHSAVAKYLLQELYATTRRLPLHKLLEDLTWIGSPNSIGAPPLRTALYKNVLGTDDVVEILEYLVGRNPAWISSLDQDGLLPLHVACRRGVSFAIFYSLVNLYKASVKSVTSEGDLPLFLACEMPRTSLDTIFLLMKLYPDLIYHRSL